MAETGSLNKAEAFRFLGLRKMENYCPCCEYSYSEAGGMDCNKCPLASLWGSNHIACEVNPDSPYAMWKHSRTVDFEGRKKYAAIIRDAAQKKLEAYIPKEETIMAKVVKIEKEEAPIKSITIELSYREAQILRFLFNKIGGHPELTPRGNIDKINNALAVAGVKVPTDVEYDGEFFLYKGMRCPSDSGE
jgi:hypothetical protein